MIVNEETGKTEFIEKVDGEEVLIEPVDDFRDAQYGSFFQYINLLDSFDLTRYQIYNSIDKKNYRDNYSVYACIQSGVFIEYEIHKLHTMMLTRNIPNKKILEIAIEMKCHFIVNRVDESRDSRHGKHDSINKSNDNVY